MGVIILIFTLGFLYLLGFFALMVLFMSVVVEEGGIRQEGMSRLTLLNGICMIGCIPCEKKRVAMIFIRFLYIISLFVCQ